MPWGVPVKLNQGFRHGPLKNCIKPALLLHLSGQGGSMERETHGTSTLNNNLGIVIGGHNLQSRLMRLDLPSGQTLLMLRNRSD